MTHTPKPLCCECDAPETNVITLFTRNPYCGRYCLAEGQLKIARWLLRVKAEETEGGNTNA